MTQNLCAIAATFAIETADYSWTTIVTVGTYTEAITAHCKFFVSEKLFSFFVDR
jgi:hypothetical protein